HALLRALAVERPAEHAIRATIPVGLQAGQPLVDERRLARAALGDQRDYLGLVVAPGFGKLLQVLVAPDQAFVGGLGKAGNSGLRFRLARRDPRRLSEIQNLR